MLLDYGVYSEILTQKLFNRHAIPLKYSIKFFWQPSMSANPGEKYSLSIKEQIENEIHKTKTEIECINGELESLPKRKIQLQRKLYRLTKKMEKCKRAQK
jgi:hypothetical protein